MSGGQALCGRGVGDWAVSEQQRSIPAFTREGFPPLRGYRACGPTARSDRPQKCRMLQCRMTQTPAPIFVFGSNLSGRHGRGAALDARLYFGARSGLGEGPSGTSYALPTKDERLRTRPLHLIRESVGRFLTHAWSRQDQVFFVTRVGCGLAGYADEDIAPMFAHRPPNVRLPGLWLRELGELKTLRLLVTAQPDRLSYQALTAVLDRQLSDLGVDVQLVVAGQQSSGEVLLNYARIHGLDARSIEPRWDQYPTQDVRRMQAQWLCWYATRMLLIEDTPSSANADLVAVAKASGLKITVLSGAATPA